MAYLTEKGLQQNAAAAAVKISAEIQFAIL